MLSCGPDCVFGWAPQKQTLTRGFECKEFIWELVPRDTGQGKGSSVRDGEEGDQRHGHEQKAAVDNWSLLGPFGRQYRASSGCSTLEARKLGCFSIHSSLSFDGRQS